MPAAIAVPLITGAVSAGAQIYGAKKASDATKKATAAQQQAANKAFQYQEAEKNRMTGLNQPFMQGMGDRVNTLRSLTTPGMRYGQPMPQAPMPQRPMMAPPLEGPPIETPMPGQYGFPQNMGQMRQPYQAR